MANEIQTAREVVKLKLDIAVADTTFDTLIDSFVEEAIPRVNPYAQNKLPQDTSVTLAIDADSFTLPVANSVLDRMYTRVNATDKWEQFDDWQQWNSTIDIETTISVATFVKILAHAPYASTDAGLLELQTDNPALTLPVYYFAMAEFAVYMVGNKRKFNIYQQMNGVRTLQEMQELADFYEQKAVRILEDEISAEGS